MRWTLVVLAVVLLAPAGAGEPDCNGNGVPDATDIAQGTSQDCDVNGIPDECDTEVSFSFRFISSSADKPRAADVADVDGDGDLDVLTASADDNKIAWYPNFDGKGLFGAQQPINLDATLAVSVVAADIDGDGDTDAIGALNSGLIQWYENTDAVGLVWAIHLISFEVALPWTVFAADLDGDSDFDVLSASQDDNKIAWYENTDGAGTFGPQRIITTQADFALGVHAADVDGDGDVDVVSASFDDDEVTWYENSDGLGTFGPPQVVSTTGDGMVSAFVADFDGDGDNDLLGASNTDGEVAWYENLDGLDGFGPQQLITDLAWGALWTEAADFDADGDLDALSASLTNNTVAWYENTDGAGGFGPQRIISATALEATAAVAADIDADGDIDVVVTSQGDDTVAWYENESDDCNANGVPDRCEADCNLNGRSDDCDIESADSADCNGNGVPDECDISGGASTDCAGEGVPDECEADCNGNSQSDSCDIDDGGSLDCTGNGVPDECEPDCNGNSQADSCDIDGGTSTDCSDNGIPDECEADCNGNSEADSCDLRLGVSLDCNENAVPDECDSGSTSVDCNANDVPDECETRVTFTAHVISVAANFPRSVFAADLDADGDVDALSASGIDDKVAWYENTDGAGSFGPQQIISADADLPLSVFAADLDGDFDLDVLSASFSDDKIAWYRQTSDPGVFGPQQVITQQADGALSVYAADLDGDSDMDVLSASFVDDELSWFENLDGQGTFGPQQVISTLSTSLFAVSAADLDGDLDMDVLSASFEDDTVAWYENLDGSGEFGSRQVVSAEADGATFVLGRDLDGDGDVDLVSASQNDDTVAWYENLDGAGDFGTAQPLNTFANGATSVFSGDVNGDGAPDVLSASFFDNTIAWYENLDGLGGFGPARIVAAAAVGAYSVFAIDVDGDGDTDVLSASQDDDTIAWYENRGDDCNGNVVPDACDISGGGSDDCTSNGVPDECEPDCNGNDVADSCDLLAGTSTDCNANGFPDECETDCNGNGSADSCDIEGGSSDDCNLNGVPDECDPDCNSNGVPDECDITKGTSLDCNSNGIPDECETDCNSNDVPDDCDLAQGTSDDCDANLVPDECDPDCNADGMPNACDNDCNTNEIPDGCEADCNSNGVPDDCDAISGPSIDCNANLVPDECETTCQVGCDSDGDRCIDELDAEPDNPNACADTDLDACDDCVSGFFRPANDGTDVDADGICSVSDCEDTNHTVWFPPGQAEALMLSASGADTLLSWQLPGVPGALLPFFDTLRSSVPDDFTTSAVCLESDQLDTQTLDGELPAGGAIFHYLIRSQNACPGFPSTLGTDSSGTPRTGAACP